MGLRIVSKIGVVLSVILFMMAVGLYMFYELDSTRKEQQVDLHTLVPDDCLGILETDNIHYYFSEFTTLNYNEEMINLPSSGLFGKMILSLHDVMQNRAHGLSSRTRAMLVSFHGSMEKLEQVMYMKVGPSDRKFLEEFLSDKIERSYTPKKEKYRGEVIYVYPLHNQHFLSVYMEDAYVVASYEKRLVEKVIDAVKDKTSITEDQVFKEAAQRTKANNHLTLYLKAAPMVSLRQSGNWTEFDVHVNSDVLYLTGETYGETDSQMLGFIDDLKLNGEICSDSILLTTRPACLDSCIREKQLIQLDGKVAPNLFESSVANLSKDASFSFVGDVDCIMRNPKRYEEYMPRFLMYNAKAFCSFIVSSQLFVHEGHVSHIIVLTYKK